MNRDSRPALWIDILVAVLTFAPIVAALIVYPDLPGHVPIHFNARGEADRWTGKSYLSVLFPVGIACFLQILLMLMVYDIAADTERVKGKDEESAARRKLLGSTNGLLQPLRLGIGALFALVSLNITAMAMQPPVISARTFILMISLCVVAMVVFAAVRSMPVLTAQSEWEAAAPADLPLFKPENWRLYNSVYSNPKDPSVFVPRRQGAGVTFNMAHPRSKLYLVLIAGLMAMPLVAIFFAL